MAARALVVALLFLCAVVAGAAAGTSPRPEPTPPPEVGATRAAQPIEVDGRLEESAWQAVASWTRFVQRDPDEGEAATEASELSLL